MVRAAARDGYFEGAHFVASVTTTSMTRHRRQRWYHSTPTSRLDLLGPGPWVAPSPLGAAEARLAAQFGWLPSALDTEPAPALDLLLAPKAAAASGCQPRLPEREGAHGRSRRLSERSWR